MATEKELTEKLRKALIAIKKLKQEIQESGSKKSKEIAIIGMSCRFPGNVKSPEDYWKLLIDGENAISEIPTARWNNEKYFNSDVSKEGKINTKYGGFISEVDLFDNSFFNISPIEAKYMDPQQRLILEVSCEALERAGLDIEGLEETNTGVFLGSAANDYARKHLNSPDNSDINIYSITGGEMYAIPGRVSYTLGLQGACVLASTACSSSLVSIHQACQSLLLGESEMALAGGSNLMISPEPYIALSKMGALSEDGQCKAFDASANGYVRGEGVGVLILKKLSDAKRDKNTILATIKATAVNQDGKSNGFTAPNMKAQEKLIEQALASAGLSIADIDFLEAHGTGTPLGDPIELQAITNIIKRNGSLKKSLKVGTVKTNFGHTEGSAGVAGVIKSILALQHQMIPQNLHFKTPNPHYNWADGLIEIPTENLAWESKEKPRIAAINSFGVSGTNAHCILSEYVGNTQNSNGKNSNIIQKHGASVRLCQENYVFPFSAKSFPALKGFAKKYAGFIEKSDNQLIDICSSAVFNKTHYGNRVAISAKDKTQLMAKLNAFANEESEDFLEVDAQNFEPKIVFVFSGHGSHWIGMGKQLWEKSAVFKQAILECEKAFSEFVDWKLTDELFAEESDSKFSEIEIIQPIICAIQIALAKLWESKNVKPDAIVGHSMGEVAAAHIAGNISLKEASQIICKRSKLMNLTKGKGTMAVVELSRGEAENELVGYEDKVSIAVMNSPTSTVLSGEPKAIATILEKLEKRDVFNKQMKIDIASHCVLMEEAKDLLKADLDSKIQPKNGEIPFYSTVSAKLVNGNSLDSDYWASNLRQPVQFSETIGKMLEDDCNTFIEISAHPVLCHALNQNFTHFDSQAFAIPSQLREKDELEIFWSAWGKLYQVGYEVDWSLLYKSDYQFIVLPTYPWQHKRFWIENKDFKVESESVEDGNPNLESEEEGGTLASVIYNFEEEEQFESIQLLLRKELLKASGYTSDQVSDQADFIALGVDSMMAMRIRKVLERELEISFPTKVFWKHSNISALANYLFEQFKVANSQNPTESENELTTAKSNQNQQAENADWFVIPKPNEQAEIRLFCFHGAGESAMMFHTWNNYLPNSVEMVNIQLPGRASRMDETPYDNLEKLITDLLPVFSEKQDKPFLFFGHSMGGMLAFFLARKLRENGFSTPTHLFISATPSLKNYEIEQRLSELSESELVKLFPDLSKNNFEDLEFFQIVMNALKADLKMADSFNYEPEKPFDFPISVISAKKDEIVNLVQMQEWELETEADFTIITRNGDHHYIRHDGEFLAKLVGESLKWKEKIEV
ncbi:MAG: acyl transferase domain-containing protein/thioesterase domain-containing protein [Flammeovirgaceae bacterium]|jgi:acyl transferase domain-containing protein/thioesterase domain-containing protein